MRCEVDGLRRKSCIRTWKRCEHGILILVSQLNLYVEIFFQFCAISRIFTTKKSGKSIHST